MTEPKPRAIRGRVLVIDAPTPSELRSIWEALQDPGVHVPIGLCTPPPFADLEAGLLTLNRGPEVSREGVRFHALRRRDDARLVGFFLDFGWDSPTDTVRELDLAFPRREDRSLASYVDATVIVCQYLFVNHLAKRLRWRISVAKGERPRRAKRQGARLLGELDERHPVTGEWVTKCIYEYALVDFQALCARGGVDPMTTDYGDMGLTVWDAYRD
jgi:hypothetical protein